MVARISFGIVFGLILSQLALAVGVVRIVPTPPTSWPAYRCRTFYEVQADPASTWERIQPLVRC